MKEVMQLNNDGYFVGKTIADESPREPGVYLIPAGAIDAPEPNIPDGYRAKWGGEDWDYEEIPYEKPEKPYESWEWDSKNKEWTAPVEKPDDGNKYIWSEEDGDWITELESKRRGAKMTRAEFKLTLLEIGELDNVRSKMTSSDVDERAQILWEDALEFQRKDSDLIRLADEMGYSEEQLDKIFGLTG